MFVRNPETKDIELYKGPALGDDGPLPDIKMLHNDLNGGSGCSTTTGWGKFL